MSILTAEGAACIKARKTLTGQPWLIGYRTKGGGYMVANDGNQSDSQKPRDLLYVLPGGPVIVLSPLVVPELATEVAAATGGEVYDAFRVAA